MRLDPAIAEEIGGSPTAGVVLGVLDMLALADFVTCLEDGTWTLTVRARELMHLGEAAAKGLAEVARG
ncbi:hypothetical protein JRI60_26945 [Archangium violaceum]|uniref:hypothetical protein n=1 Tax=Archangium violaceum TaxID=83451 RepID=UPI00194F24A0|nr:hypothetical protein [Archangium violaceum]QRN92850.1 hypothetical protein JRI60_26945 [Archangium violaceum]